MECQKRSDRINDDFSEKPVEDQLYCQAIHTDDEQQVRNIRQMQNIAQRIGDTRNNQKVLNHNKTAGEKMFFDVSSENQNIDNRGQNAKNENIYFHNIQTDADVLCRKEQAQEVEHQNSRLGNSKQHPLFFWLSAF